MYNETVKAACILDKHDYDSLKFECNLIQMDRSNWENVIKYENPTFVIVGESLQSDIDLLNITNSCGNVIGNIAQRCKENRIPTIFWSKEDPVGFEACKEAAKYFEYIFTCDINCVKKYKDIVGHDNVYLLENAVQPRLYNPVGRKNTKLPKLAFVGAWNRQYTEKPDELNMLLKPALKHGIHIYESEFDTCAKVHSFYPGVYRPYIRKHSSYSDMASLYKDYDIFLDLNPAKNSLSAIPARVYEMLASGSCVIGNYSMGAEMNLNEAVKLCKTSQEVSSRIKQLTGDEILRKRISVLSQREVFNKHTYRHRIDTILDKAGIKLNKVHIPKVTILVSTNRLEYMENIFENYERQTHKNKELIIILNNNRLDIKEWSRRAEFCENAFIYRLDESISLGECLNYGIEHTASEYVSKFDDDDYYGPEFLNDLLNAFKYTHAAIVGKKAVFVYFEKDSKLALMTPNMENMYTGFVNGGTMLIKREVFDEVKFRDMMPGEDVDFLTRCVEKGFKIYSTDRFNYVYIRRVQEESHTWKASEKEVMGMCVPIGKIDDYRGYATV